MEGIVRITSITTLSVLMTGKDKNMIKNIEIITEKRSTRGEKRRRGSTIIEISTGGKEEKEIDPTIKKAWKRRGVEAEAEVEKKEEKRKNQNIDVNS